MSRILYVEDNDSNVFMLKGRLERKGYTMLVATNGAEGVELSRSELPDLILMDLRMPVLDGWQATAKIKHTPETAHIPIIALSAHAMTGDSVRALQAGCDDYDTKPVDMARLLGKIEFLLARKSRS